MPVSHLNVQPVAFSQSTLAKPPSSPVLPPPLPTHWFFYRRTEQRQRGPFCPSSKQFPLSAFPFTRKRQAVSRCCEQSLLWQWVPFLEFFKLVSEVRKAL